jgi:hypothetical protein
VRIDRRSALALAGLALTGAATVGVLLVPAKAPPPYRTPSTLAAQLAQALAGASVPKTSPAAANGLGEVSPSPSPTRAARRSPAVRTTSSPATATGTPGRARPRNEPAVRH